MLSRLDSIVSRGSLVILASLVSLFGLFVFLIPSRIPRLVTQGALVSIVILDILSPLVNLVSLGIHFIIVSRSIQVSLICLGLCLGADGT